MFVHFYPYLAPTSTPRRSADGVYDEYRLTEPPERGRVRGRRAAARRAPSGPPEQPSRPTRP